MAGAKSGGSKRARLLSTILYVISAVLIVVVVVLYFQGRGDKTQVPPTPQSIPGQNQLINVVDVLKSQGLSVSVTPHGAHADEFTPPGQGLDVNGKPVFVFVYNSPDERTVDSDGVDLTNITLTAAGTPVPADQLKVYGQSNIIAVLVGGDASLAAKVEAGMKALP